MLKQTCLSCIVLLIPFKAMAMQALNDDAMSKMTAQDGITISIASNNSTIAYSAISLIDTDGYSNTMNKAAALSIAPINYDTSSGIKFQDSAGNAINGDFMTINVDADGNNGEPFTNINVSFDSVRKIELSPFAVYLTPNTGVYGNTPRILGEGSQTNKIVSGATQLLYIPTFDIVFNEQSPLSINLQLGHAPQGQMFKIASGSLQSLGTNNNKVAVLSANGDSNDKLEFGINMIATNTTTGFRLHEFSSNGNQFSGFYGGVNPDGLYLKADGKTDAMNVEINNLTFGVAGQSSGNSFAGLQNGSMGTLGLSGVRVKDLELNVKGL